MTKSVLFACNMNSVRSPMAAALLRLQNAEGFSVDSAGVYEGGLDPFVEIVMGELDVAMHDHEPKMLNDVDLTGFNVVIALTPEAAVEARFKVTKDIQIAAFADAGSVSAQNMPDFDERFFVGVGGGVRYFTPIGPLRADVAFPLDPRESDRNFQIFIAIGQPF